MKGDKFMKKAWALTAIVFALVAFAHTSLADDNPIPEISGDADVAGALAGSADGRLATYITTVAEYNAFRGWVDANGLDHEAVKNSTRAWFSYALDATNLVECAFEDGDIAIVSLQTATNGSFSFEVDVKDVPLGASATATNLATVFEVLGSPSLSDEAFSATNVTVALDVSTNGGLLVNATPNAAYGTFFARVRMLADDDRPADPHKKVQLWAGGPYWAETNIGAEEPWEYGYYFWWGGTVGYKREGSKWVANDGSSSNFSFTKEDIWTWGASYDSLTNAGYITSDKILTPDHDAAHVHWGGGWRMPTKQEIDDLNRKCSWTWTTTNSIYGYIVRGKDDFASASIFFPAAGIGDGTSLKRSGSWGCYWSSVPYWTTSQHAYHLHLISSGHTTDYGNGTCRGFGLPIRPVQSVGE